MDTSSPPTTAALGQSTNTKLRLMCSYGGKIISRPNKKLLFYSGGETRLVAVDRRTTVANFSIFRAHLSRKLFNNQPFVLKYQIPNEDIDALISVTNDDDLQNMIDEHERAVCSVVPARIRLFLFPIKPESTVTNLLDLKSETWFDDALNSSSSMMIQRGGESDNAGDGLINFDGSDHKNSGESLSKDVGENKMGLLDNAGHGLIDFNGSGHGLIDIDGSGHGLIDIDGSGEGLSKGVGEDKKGFVKSGSESMNLEANSSHGSGGSSTSMPANGVCGEDLQEKETTVASSVPLDSELTVASGVCHPKTGFNNDQAVHITSLGDEVFSNAMKPESIILDPSSMIQMQNAAQVSAYQLPIVPEGRLHQQVQYVHAGGHYMSQHPAGSLPISSYYPVYQPQLHPPNLQHHVPYPPNPPYPFCLLPIRPTQSSDISVTHNLNNAVPIPSSLPPLHPQTSMFSNQVAYKEVTPAQLLPELTSDIHWNAVSSIQRQQPLALSDSYQPPLSAASGTLGTANRSAESLAYALYISQPPAPATSYEEMTKTANVLLHENSTQLHGTSVQH